MPSVLEKTESQLRSLSFRGANEAELVAIAAGLRACQRIIEAQLLSVAQHATKLHERGEACSARELLAVGDQVSNATATREALRADAASAMPIFGEALANGEVSGEHLDVLARHTRGLDDEQRNLLDLDALAAAAKKSGPDQFNRSARRIVDKAKNDWGLGRTIEDRKRSQFRTWHDRETGMGRISGWLDPERFSQIRAALDAETTALANDRKADGTIVKKDEFLAADVFVSLIERGATNQAGVTRPIVHLHADISTAVHGPHTRATQETAEGFHLPPESLQRLLCDSVIQAVVFDGDGSVLNVGRRSRTATDKQWAALRASYRTCAWDRCERPIDHCQAHHIHYWEHDGLTDLDNLVPLCSHHHHRVHDQHWGLELLPDRQLKIYRPDGHYWATAKPDRPPGVACAGV